MFVEEPRLALMLIFSIYLLVTLSDAESTSNITDYWTYSNLDNHQMCGGNQQSPVNIQRTGMEKLNSINLILYFITLFMILSCQIYEQY